MKSSLTAVLKGSCVEVNEIERGFIIQRGIRIVILSEIRLMPDGVVSEEIPLGKDLVEKYTNASKGVFK